MNTGKILLAISITFGLFVIWVFICCISFVDKETGEVVKPLWIKAAYIVQYITGVILAVLFVMLFRRDINE